MLLTTIYINAPKYRKKDKEEQCLVLKLYLKFIKKVKTSTYSEYSLILFNIQIISQLDYCAITDTNHITEVNSVTFNFSFKLVKETPENHMLTYCNRSFFQLVHSKVCNVFAGLGRMIQREEEKELWKSN